MAKGSAAKDEYGLNPNQRRFADEYLLNGCNASAAYRVAYPKARRAVDAAASRLLKDVKISQYIEKRQKMLRKQAEKNSIASLEGHVAELLRLYETPTTDVMRRTPKGVEEVSFSKMEILKHIARVMGFERIINENHNIDNGININFTAVDDYFKGKEGGGDD